ncbi:outer membrane protein [Sphingomonas arantia]|uniref:Outer membrane protein n=2 Tax=Sphingomonas TaxID=13687 RepID=A0ABW4TUH3_9SPHN
MKMFRIVPAFGLALAVGSPAMAQVTDSWTGPYVGGQLGYGFQPKDRGEAVLFDNNLDGTFGDTVNTAAGANAFSPGTCGGSAATNVPAGGCVGDRNGVDWKVHAGYDMQFGSIVVGVVGDYGRATISDSVSTYSTTPASYTMTRRLRDNASIRARAGFALGDTLIYGTGGGAWGKVRNSFASTNVANVFTGNGNDDAWGYRVGGGIEQRVAPNFSIGAQYLFTSLKDGSYNVRTSRGTSPANNPFVLVNTDGTDFRRSGDRFNSHVAAVTASFRF